MSSQQTATAAPHLRLTAAWLPRRLTVGARLAISVALSVALVISVVTWGAIRLAAGQMQTDLRETVRLTAVAVANEIELRNDAQSQDAVAGMLREFLDAAIDLRSISVFRAERGTAVPVASTSLIASAPLNDVQRVVSTGKEQWTEGVNVVSLTVPVREGNDVTGAVAVAVSLGSVQRVERTVGFVAAGAALVTIASLTLLLHLLARRLILEPLWEIQRVMGRARNGDLSARAEIVRVDELREVGDGLNAMLAELEDLHRSLNAKVAAATATLRDRNEQLVRSYESVLQLRDAVAHAQQLATIGQTVANVAHQIGTPLNLVSGHVQLLQHEVADPALRRRLLIVRDQVERVTSTVRDLLRRAKPEHEVKPVDLAALLERLGEAIRPRLDAARIALTISAPHGLPLVLADDTQLELALANLVSNAVDAMPNGGSLTLVLDARDAGVRLTIQDTGAGIPPEILARVFEPWVTTKAAGRGTGLGLTITRDVIVGLDGHIDVASVPGRGTTFTIDLPGADAPSST